MAIKNRFAELHDEIRAWRQDFHQHPEIMFETHRTAGVVESRLKEFGADEVVTGIGRTGVVGVIQVKKPVGPRHRVARVWTRPCRRQICRMPAK